MLILCVRRYIGLRWSTPIPRKKAKVSRAIAKRERTQSAASSTEMNGGESPSGLLRPGKKIVGFILGELDVSRGRLCDSGRTRPALTCPQSLAHAQLSNGTLFLPLIMPSGSVGDTYEATTTLLQHLSERIFGDLARLNAERTAQKLKTLPELNEVWTMSKWCLLRPKMCNVARHASDELTPPPLLGAALFTKDPRGVNHLETRRGFSTLEKCTPSTPSARRRAARRARLKLTSPIVLSVSAAHRRQTEPSVKALPLLASLIRHPSART